MGIEAKGYSVVEQINYNLNTFRILTDSIEEAGGEINPEIELLYKGITGDIASNVDFLSRIITRLKTLEKEYRDEAAAATKIARGYDRQREYILERVKQFLIENNRKEISGNTKTFCLQKTMPTVFVADESGIPEEYFDKEIALQRLKSALLEGAVIKGCELKENVFLKIKRKGKDDAESKE